MLAGVCCSSRASVGQSSSLNLCYFPVSARSPALGAPTSRDIIRSRPPRARRSWCYPAQMPGRSGLWAARMAQPMGLWQQQVTFLPGWASAVPGVLSPAQRSAGELTGGSWRLSVRPEFGGDWASSPRAPLAHEWGWGKDQLPPFTSRDTGITTHFPVLFGADTGMSCGGFAL